jgi:hypothetical protein
MDQVKEEVTPFRVSHTNVDGAGHVAYFETKEEALDRATEMALQSAGSGNPWGYRYHVWAYGRGVCTIECD